MIPTMHGRIGLAAVGLGLSLAACGDQRPPAQRIEVGAQPGPAMVMQVPVAMTAPMPPPPARSELVPPPPMQGAIWQPGHWRFAGPNGWDWVSGGYVMPPPGRSMWQPGQWQQAAGGGWIWAEGHWM